MREKSDLCGGWEMEEVQIKKEALGMLWGDREESEGSVT